MYRSSQNLIVFGTGKTTFCQLMTKIYGPFCPETIADVHTIPTEACNTYRIQHRIFNSVNTMNLIDTPHDIRNMGWSFLMVEPTHLVFLFDLSQPDELNNLQSLVRCSRDYYDCNNKLFIGVNRTGKTISDRDIRAVMTTFSNSKYLEIDMIKSEYGTFSSDDLTDSFNIITQHIYEGVEEIEDDDEYGGAYYTYMELPLHLHLEFPINKVKIMKNSKFVTQEYFNRVKDSIKCCICFDQIKTLDNFVYTWCGHEYCGDCYPKMEECFCKTSIEL